MRSELLKTLKKLKDSVSGKDDIKRVLLGESRSKKLENLAVELEGKYGAGIKPRPTTDLIALQAKAKRIYQQSNETFSSIEISNLPFILFEDAMNDTMFNFLLEKYIDLSREMRLRRLLHVYFQNYAENKATKAVANKILVYFRSKQEIDFKSSFHKNIFKHRNNLFSSASKLLMIRMYQQNGLEGTLEQLGFKGTLETSKFVLQTLKEYYADGSNDNVKYTIFNELAKRNFNGYQQILPTILDSLIILTDKSNNNNWRKYLLQFAYQLLGDPRLPLDQTKWNGTDGVSRKAQQIFLKWLANNDLTLFFLIIDQTATDRMWRYRDRFWRAYLDYIVNTKVFFGVEAQRIARQVAKDELLNYGSLEYGSESNHSAFLFEIGRYTFCEWSHNGKLYIWRSDEAPVHFSDFRTGKSKMTRSNYVEAFVHSNADRYNWQSKVADWLAKHCGIKKSRFDWG